MALYYAATVTLGMSDRQFWRCTLRKLCALIEFHNGVNKAREQPDPMATLFG